MPVLYTFAASGTPTTGTAPLTVSFTSDASSTIGGEYWASSAWDFGDGTTSTLQNPTHTYTTAGTFSASCLVTNTFGQSATPMPTVITVAAPTPPPPPPGPPPPPIIGTTSGTLFYPLKLLNYRDYADLTIRTIQSTWPTEVYDDGAYPLRHLSFWPVPQNAYAVELWMWAPLADYASLDDELNLPPGYERYLILKLAMEVAPEFGKQVTETLKATLAEAESAIKTLNQQSAVMKPSVGMYGLTGRRPWARGSSDRQF